MLTNGEGGGATAASGGGGGGVVAAAGGSGANGRPPPLPPPPPPPGAHETILWHQLLIAFRISSHVVTEVNPDESGPGHPGGTRPIDWKVENIVVICCCMEGAMRVHNELSVGRCGAMVFVKASHWACNAGLVTP